jgi:arylsulfatase A-like enzyme/Flp pilus assembly protein TadD
LCVAASLLSAIGCARAPRQADLRAVTGQNVLLITIDTLRADALGIYGGRAATPALDRLAREGVRFDFAHAHAVVTLPSHASILTGQYPFRHGLRDNSGYRLRAGTRTAASSFKQAGYATAAFVSAFPLHSRFGLNQGFDVYDDAFGETRDPTEFVMPERPASAVVPIARDWISRRGSERWFVWLHVFDPHAPYRPPPPFDAQYASHPYDGEVAATDAALAPLLADLRAAGRPTFVVVTSDHGEALGDHGEASHGLFAYESTLRVPLIFAETGAQIGAEISAGRSKDGGEVSDVPARHVDVLPSLLDAAGVSIPQDLAGRSLLPAAERRGEAPPRVSYFEAMSGMLNRGWAPLAGVLVDREKFIELPLPERYNLVTDTGETVNLNGRDQTRDRALVEVLRSFSSTRPAERLAEDADATARLRALGYLSGSPAPKRQFTEADDPKRLVGLDDDVHRAVEAFVAGRSADAEAIYRNVIDRRPDMAIAYRHLAFLLAHRGNLSEAIAVLRQGVTAGVTDRRVLTLLGEYLADGGRSAQAIQMLEPLSNAPDADADVLNTLGIAYAQAGRREAARRTFERVIAINPGSSVPLENLGMLALEEGDARSARKRFEDAIAADSRSSRAHSGLGAALQRLGEHDRAIDEWKAAVQLDGTNLDALYNIGTALAASHMVADARPYLERFLQTAPPSRAADRREVARLLAK